MLSFHDVESINITEARAHGSGYTNELIISTSDRDYRIDFFARSRNALRVHDEMFKTLRQLIQELTEAEGLPEN